MDEIDRKILRELQFDASQPVAAIAQKVGISTTPCWRRIQNMEKALIITRRVALLDREALNIGVTVFVNIRTNVHSTDALSSLARSIADIDEVIDFYRMSGTVDYMMRIVVPDIAAYDAVYKRLVQLPGIIDVSSSFAMEEIKRTTELPLTYMR